MILSWRTVLFVLSIGLGGIWAGREIVALWQEPLPDLRPPSSVQVVDRNGELLRLFLTDDGYWRLPATLEQIDPAFIEALLAYEDRRYYTHPGVDPLALGRALLQWAWEGEAVSGASTLTMQTLRLLKPRPRTLANKLREMAQALRLEAELSKREILERYLTLAPYGGNIQGVRAASLLYLGREPAHLTPSEIALLIALPQAPEGRRPDRFPQNARKARAKVLERLAGAGLLSAEQAMIAATQELPSQRLPTPQLAPHLARRLWEAEPIRDYAAEPLRTTLEANLQRAAERLAARHQQKLESGVTLAALVVDNRDRSLVAHVGSGSYIDISQLDLTRAVRSPGSALKPFIYGLGFERSLIHPETHTIDRAQRVGLYRPENFDLNYMGEVSLREALHFSLNIPAVKVLEKVQPLRVLQRFEEVGQPLQLPRRGEAGLSLALGGVGISLESITGLYSALAHRGEYLPLRAAPDEQTSKPVMLLSPEAAWQVDDILRETPVPDGYRRNRPIRYKTGTSYGFRDAWAIGYDADYTVGVWIGRPDGGYSSRLVGREAAAPLLFDLFERLPRNGGVLWNARPPGVLIARHAELPESLRWLGEDPGGDAPPAIRSPVDGSTVVLSQEGSVILQADGGRAPYHWLVNGEHLPTAGYERRVRWQPDGPGFARITLIDGEGRSARSEVWLR